MASQKGVARTHEFALLVGHAGADWSAGGSLLHKRRPILCGSERSGRHRGGARRCALSARWRRRPDLQRVGDCGVLSPAFRCHSSHYRRSRERCSQAGIAARHGAYFHDEREGIGAGSGLAPHPHSHRARRPSLDELWRQPVRTRGRLSRARASAQCRDGDRSCSRSRFACRASVHSRHPGARRWARGY
jgi:hypothetical protein